MQFLHSAFCRVQQAKMFLFHPAQTLDMAWLCMWEGEQDLVCQGAVTACEEGLVLVNTPWSAVSFGCEPKFFKLEGEKEFCIMHYKQQIKPLWSS